MALEDYIKRWTVGWVAPQSSVEKVDHKIDIEKASEGSEETVGHKIDTDVKVSCAVCQRVYAKAAYVEAEDAIIGDGYRITYVAAKCQIEHYPTTLRGGGTPTPSWTADDKGNEGEG